MTTSPRRKPRKRNGTSRVPTQKVPMHHGVKAGKKTVLVRPGMGNAAFEKATGHAVKGTVPVRRVRETVPTLHAARATVVRNYRARVNARREMVSADRRDHSVVRAVRNPMATSCTNC